MQEWCAACAKLKLGVFNPKHECIAALNRTIFGARAITNFAANGVNEDAAMSVTGHKPLRRTSDTRSAALQCNARRLVQ